MAEENKKEQQVKPAKTSEKKLKYIGPPCKVLTVPALNVSFPTDLDQEGIKSLISIHPQLARYFK